VEHINPIKTELNSIGSILGTFSAITPYKAPEGYFDNFPENMLLTIREEAVPSFPSHQESPYQVPPGYFDGLAGSILQKAKAGFEKDGDDLSPLMSQLREENVYKIPEGYFEKLPAQIVEKLADRQPAKLVTGKFPVNSIRRAAAAVVTGLIIVTGFLLVNNKTSNSIASETRLIETTNQTTDEEILDYLEDQPLSATDLQLLITEIDFEEDVIKDMLADVSDEELQQYLQLQSDTKQLIN
jgi:hypothetical protein